MLLLFAGRMDRRVALHSLSESSHESRRRWPCAPALALALERPEPEALPPAAPAAPAMLPLRECIACLSSSDMPPSGEGACAARSLAVSVCVCAADPARGGRHQ